MALFRGIQEYIALDANNITLVFDSGNIVNISGNIFLYPPQGHPILYNYPGSFGREMELFYVLWQWKSKINTTNKRAFTTSRKARCMF